MINYLINNSMNATYVTNAISSHHSNTGPILTSWRDLIDVFVITLCMGFFIYLLMCHAACSPRDRCLSFIFKRTITRLKEQQLPPLAPASITPTPTQRIITP
ncbi:unnamed protein product, partial [Rotaria magnacalcarata]